MKSNTIRFAVVCMVSTLTYVCAEVTKTSRQATLDYWTPEMRRSVTMNEILIDSDESGLRYQIETLDNGLYHLIPDNEESNTRALKNVKRSLQTEVQLEEPMDGESFTNPRSVTFKASIDPSLEELTFVFVSAEGGETPSVVKRPNEVDETGVAHEMVGGFSHGEWTWHVEGKKDGVLVTSATSSFTIEGPTRRDLQDGVVGLADWNMGGADGGQVQKASGRLYFRKGDGRNSACSGTAVRDNKTGRSLILTAAHCIYDDGFHSREGWHMDVLFIPNREDTQDGTHEIDCAKNPCGCWTASAGILHKEYQELQFPYSLQYDYGFLVVDDMGSHSGTVCENTEALDIAVGAMDFKTSGEQIGQHVFGMGYPYYWGQDLKYCSETSTEKTVYFGNFMWLDKCGLLGGSSGGPQLRNFNTADGTGEIITVNSWGYGNNPGMASVALDDSAARCLMNQARNSDFEALEAMPIKEQGQFVSCLDRPCESSPPQLARRGLRGMGTIRTDCNHQN